MKNPNILKWILIVGITVVLNLFFYYAIATIYSAPKYDAFCVPKQDNIQPTTQAECVNGGGQWNENSSIETAPAPADTTRPISKTTSFCDINYTCAKNYQTASDLYSRNVFIALVVLGVISLVAGFFFSSVTAVSLGLSFGGVLSLIIGSMRYWSAMDDYLRVIILGLALVALIWLGVKKIQD